jgi:23S rRNA-/tRNA-specific pseudouridylate synthase
MSLHRLYVETGRWHQPRAIRKCSECNVLEDEFHFVLQCNRYIYLRTQFTGRSQYYWRHPNMIKFIAVINSDNDTMIKRIACYIEKAFNVRNNTIFIQRY